MLPEVPEPVLGAEERRNWIRTHIRSAIWETVSGASILAELREWGLSISTSEFYSIRREVLGLGVYEERIRELGPDDLVPRAWMHVRPGFKLTAGAQYRFKLRVTDIDTGEEKTLVRAIASDRHYTKGEAQDVIRGLFTMPSATSNYVVDEVDLFEVWVMRGAYLER